jgi:serine/threonine protein kinase
MALSVGTRLGPYEIVSAIGAGGMGEVYRAKDTRLDRTVAVKVLPSHLVSDPELKQRMAPTSWSWSISKARLSRNASGKARFLSIKF